MSGLLAAEWLKLRTRWMPRVILLILLGILALIFWGIGTGNDRVNLFFPRGVLAAWVIGATLSSFLWPVLGGSWAGSEYGWGTIRMVLSRQPDRLRFALAGLITVLVSVVIGLLAAVVVEFIAGTIVAAATGNNAVDTSGLGGNFLPTLIKVFFGAWFAVSFYVILAYTTGTVFRSSAVGIGIGIGFIVAELVVTGIFRGIGGAWGHIADHFPGAYANNLPTQIARKEMLAGFAGDNTSRPGVTESVIVLAIYIAILLAITMVVVARRDVTA